MIKRLIAIRFRSAFAAMTSSRRGGSENGKSIPRLIMLSVLYLFLIGTFLMMSSSIAYILGLALLTEGMDAMYFGFAVLASFLIVFFLSIFETKSELFECKDIDLLLPMPIKPGHIVISRVITVLLCNLGEALIICVPFSVIYAMSGMSIAVAILGALSSLLASLFATALASAFGYLIARIAKKLKNNTFLTSLISVLFFLVFFGGYYALIGMLPAEDEEVILIPENPFISFFGGFAEGNYLSFILIAVLSLGSAFLAYYLISKNFIAIATDNGGTSRKKYKKKALKKGTSIGALTKKELRRFFSSSTYILNSSMGLILGVIFAGFLLFGGENILSLIPELSAQLPSGMIESVILIAMTFMLSFNTISSAALSLEGKSLWILKSMPISSRDVLIAKTLPHVIITSVPAVAISTVIAIVLKLSPLWFTAYLIVPILTNVICAILGTVINVAFPKFEFDNEAQPIKQSLSTFLAMLGEIVVSVIISAAVTLGVIFLGEIVGVILAIVACLVIAALLLLILLTVSVNSYEEM